MHACTTDQIAATILAKAVSTGTGLAVLDTGSKTLIMTSTQQCGSAMVKGRPRSCFLRLSEEHGVLGLGAGREACS
jgi:D-serine deaminase-like pyridoxal phosphate-dependent protein